MIDETTARPQSTPQEGSTSHLNNEQVLSLPDSGTHFDSQYRFRFSGSFLEVMNAHFLRLVRLYDANRLGEIVHGLNASLFQEYLPGQAKNKQQDWNKSQILEDMNSRAAFALFSVRSGEDLAVIERALEKKPIMMRVLLSIYMRILEEIGEIYSKFTQKVVKNNQNARGTFPVPPEFMSELQRIDAFTTLFLEIYVGVAQFLGRERPVNTKDFDHIQYELVAVINNAFTTFEDLLLGTRRAPESSVWEFEDMEQWYETYGQQMLEDEGISPVLLLPFFLQNLKTNLDRTQSGQAAKEASIFYEEMAEHLYDTASETTGDTQMHRELLLTALLHLCKENTLPQNYNWLDAGSGNGERVTRPVLSSLVELGYAPGKLLMADLNPPKKTDFWQPVQANMGTPEFFESVRDHLAVGEKLNVVSLIWSPLNDLDGYEQLTAIHNFNHLLADVGILILEAPAGYSDEKAKQRGKDRMPLNYVRVSFMGSEGQPVGKFFTINDLHEYLAMMSIMGFEHVSLGKNARLPTAYQTSTGKDRWFLLFRKVKEPDTAILGSLMSV